MSTPEPHKPKILVDRVLGDPANLPEGVVHAPGRGPDEPPRLPQQVEVSDDPQLSAWIRQTYEADLDERCAAALDRVRRGALVYLEHRDALRQRSARAVAELQRILIVDEPKIPAKGRARAAEVLAGLGHPEGIEFLLSALDSPAATHAGDLKDEEVQLVVAALEMLGDHHLKIDLTQPDVAARIVKLLSSPHAEVVKKAVHLCAWRKVPGAEDGLRAAVVSGRGPVDALAETLAHLATTPESVLAALPHLFHKRQKKYTSSISFRYRRTLDHPDPAVSGPLRQALLRQLLSYESDEDRLGQHWADDLSVVADASVTPVLEDIVARARDIVTRAYALRALARLEPERAVERVLAEMQRERPWSMLLRLLKQYAVEADYDRIAAVLYPPAESAKKRRLETDEARMLLENLGQRGRDWLAGNLDRLEAHARAWVMWKLQGLDVGTALAELHAAGVIQHTPDEVLARLAERRKAEDGEGRGALDTTEPALLTAALSQAGLTVYFDTETGFVPCRHDHLIEEFARGSVGRCTPECLVQVWHRQGETDYQAPYTVHFLYRGRAYRFRAENYGDYYDVAAVVRALNAALEHNGQPERYLGLHTGDQCARFVFADPAVFVPIAQRYGLPLAQDPAEGMRAGRAFEQHVAGQLDQRK